MLQIKSLTITHKKDLRTIVRDFNLVLNSGDKAVLIGEEGNGKSTLLKWIFDPALVENYVEADGIRTSQGELVGYLPQELSEEDKKKTVYEFFSGLQAFQMATAADLYIKVLYGRLVQGPFIALSFVDLYRAGRAY